MKKAEIFTLEEKKKQQIERELQMTPEQRFDLAFELMELAVEISPEKRLSSSHDDIEWIELTIKK